MASVTIADEKPVLAIAFVGHVDHGKSTMIGRIRHELSAVAGATDAVLAGNWAHAMDQLQEERDREMTIDTTTAQGYDEFWRLNAMHLKRISIKGPLLLCMLAGLATLFLASLSIAREPIRAVTGTVTKVSGADTLQVTTPERTDRNIRVAITGPVNLAYKAGDADMLERMAYESFGSLAAKGLLDEVLQVGTPYEFMGRLANVARAAIAKGRQIDRLIINGHGSGVEAGFSLGALAFLPRHTELAAIRQDLLASRNELWEKKARWMTLSHASPRGGVDAGALPKLEADMGQLENKIARLGQYLLDVKTVSMAMAPGAQIVYAVCFAARTRENLAFATTLGSMLLGKAGGTILASKTGVTPVRNSWLETFLGIPNDTKLQSQGKLADWLVNGREDRVTIDWWVENWVLVPIPKSASFDTPLLVQFTPDAKDVDSGSTPTFEPKIRTLPGAERLAYRWQGPCQNPAGAVCKATLMSSSEGLSIIGLNVIDPLGNTGEGRLFLWKKAADAKPPVLPTGAGAASTAGYWMFVEAASQKRTPGQAPRVTNSVASVGAGSISGSETTTILDEGPSTWAGECSWRWWRGTGGLDVLKPGDVVEVSMTATDRSEPEKVSGWNHGSMGMSGNIRFDRPGMAVGTVHRAATDLVQVSAGWKQSQTQQGKAAVPRGPGDADWGGRMALVANCGFGRFERVYRWVVGTLPPASAPEAPRPDRLTGTWSGQWSNNLGERGADSLVVTEDEAGNISGTWSGNVPITGTRTGATTFDLVGRTATREYKGTGALAGGTLTLEYTVRRLNAAGTYTGRSTFTQQP